MTITPLILATSVGLAALLAITYRVYLLLKAIQQHREAQAVSILKHSGLLEGHPNE